MKKLQHDFTAKPMEAVRILTVSAWPQLLPGFPLFYPRQIPWFFSCFPNSFPWFFLSFHQDILVFFLNVALVTLVYANIASLSAISWQLLRFNSLKNIFLRFIGLKGLKMVWKKVPWFEFFSLILAENPLTGKGLQNFPWFPCSVGTLTTGNTDPVTYSFIYPG